MKIAEISNKEEYKRNKYRIRLVDKESYIYGDEILVNFEPVYNSLIRSLPLYIKGVEKSNTEKKNIFIRFWTGDKDKQFWVDQQERKQVLFEKPNKDNCLFSDENKDRFTISVRSFENLYSIIKLLLKNDNYKTLKEDRFFKFKDQGMSSILESYGKSSEEIGQTLLKNSKEDLALLKEFNK